MGNHRLALTRALLWLRAQHVPRDLRAQPPSALPEADGSISRSLGNEPPQWRAGSCPLAFSVGSSEGQDQPHFGIARLSSAPSSFDGEAGNSRYARAACHRSGFGDYVCSQSMSLE